MSTLAMSDRAANIEAVESRLKDDILQEAARNGDLFLVHEEDTDGRLIPTWVNVGADSVWTVRELFQSIEAAGWQVDYHRVPIGANQAIENNYVSVGGLMLCSGLFCAYNGMRVQLDAYAQIFKRVDPRSTSLVANCGAGVNRTTFAMVAAILIRRKQLLLLSHPDPISKAPASTRSPALASAALPVSNGPTSALAKSVEAKTQQHAQSRALLRLIKTLSDAFSRQTSQSLTELLFAEPLLVDNMRSAMAGDYGVVRQLAGLLDEGLDTKAVVDAAIDACAHVTNLREAIMVDRVQYAAQSARKDEPDHVHLGKALRSLER